MFGAYLEAALEEGGQDPAFMAQSLGVIARSGYLSELASQGRDEPRGSPQSTVAEGNPSFATVVKVAAALGLRLRFEPAT